MNNYAKSCFASPGGFSHVFVVSIHKLIDIVPEPGVEHTVSTILGVWNEFLHPHPSAIEDLCPCKFLLAIDFTRFGESMIENNLIPSSDKVLTGKTNTVA